MIALRSTESIGLDLLGATENSGDVPDGQFFAWLGQAQFARRLFGSDWQLNLRGDVQLTADPLLPIERIAIGGIDTVRGYRENELVVDNGWIASAELRIPLGQLAVPGLSADARRRRPAAGAVRRRRRRLEPRGAGPRGERHLRASAPGCAGSRTGGSISASTSPRRSSTCPTPEEDDLQDLALYFELVMRFY